MTPEQHREFQYSDLAKRMGKLQKSQQRKRDESLAAQGAFHGGARTAAHREIEGDVYDQYRSQGMDIENQYQAAAEAARARAWQTGEREGSQGWQTGERVGTQGWQTGERTDTQGWQTGERVGTQGWQTGEREGTQTWQSGESELNRVHDLVRQTQGEEAARQLQSDSAFYRSQLEAQVQSGAMTEADAQRSYNQWSQQAAQQYGFASQYSQQGYGMDMANQQNQWDVYGQTLGYQHDYGMNQIAQQYGWDTMMATQGFQSGMAEYGWNVQQAQNQWNAYMAQLDRNGQYHMQHIAQQGNGWMDAIRSVFGGVGQVVGMTNPWNWGEK